MESIVSDDYNEDDASLSADDQVNTAFMFVMNIARAMVK